MARHRRRRSNSNSSRLSLYHALPVFSDVAALHARPEWLSYLSGVYGEGSLRFPLDVRAFNFFYRRDVNFSHAVGTVPLLGRRAHRNETLAVTLAETLIKVGGGSARWFGLSGRHLHDAFRLYHNPPYPADAAYGTLWLYGHDSRSSSKPSNDSSVADPGTVPSAGFRSFARVEVFHCAEEAQADPRDFWMYLSKGSGIYFDLGKTAVFRNRCELWRRRAVGVPRMSLRFLPRCWRRREDWAWNTSRSAPPPATFASLVSN
jgi:hypothetical protein